MSNHELPTPVMGADLATTLKHGLAMLTLNRQYPYHSFTAEANTVFIETVPQLPNNLFEQAHTDSLASANVDGMPTVRAILPLEGEDTAVVYGRQLGPSREVTNLEHESAFEVVRFLGKIAAPVYSAVLTFHASRPPSLLLDMPYPSERKARQQFIEAVYEPTMVRTDKDTATFSNHRLLPMQDGVGGGDLDIAVREPKDTRHLVRIPRRRFGRRQFETLTSQLGDQ